jgi:succinate dehydrogenase / fumarate reductase flavoprotein subunit
MVRKFEFWDFLSLVQDDAGVTRGLVAQDLKSMQIRAFPADAVCLATGGPGIIFGRSTNSVINTGTAASAVYQQGACYANGEFIQVHPTAIPGADKLRLISESARGVGGRFWVPKDPKEKRRGRDVPEKDRAYFLEDKYPGYGNLVPRDIASRELFLKCMHEQRGVFNPKSGKNENEVYLDLTHLPQEMLRKKLAGILEIYEKFAGEDPYENPMRVFPAVHYSMGGLWVDFERASDGTPVKGSPRNHSTNLEGLYAAGEVDYQYHGANRLGANSLLSCIYTGMITGPAMATYRKNLARSAWDLPSGLFEKAERRETEKYEAILEMAGDENPYRLHEELGNTMLLDVTIERHNDKLDGVLSKIDEIEERAGRVLVTDTSAHSNQGAQFVRHLFNMIVVARVIAQGAKNRDESRGAHFKPAFKDRNDADWLRTTLAFHKAGDGKEGRASVDYKRSLEYSLAGQRVQVADTVDTSLVQPRARKYETAGAASASAKGALTQPSAKTDGKVGAAPPSTKAPDA